MGDANPYRLHTCYHCLNTGLMKILHREIYQEYEYWDDMIVPLEMNILGCCSVVPFAVN